MPHDRFLDFQYPEVAALLGLTINGYDLQRGRGGRGTTGAGV